nr:marine proteobacterial sortase target protein [Thioalkalivibrio sp. XN279]
MLAPGVVWFPDDAAAQADPAPWESGAGGLWLKASLDDEPVAALSVGTEIRARVTGNTGRIEVTQRFSNPRDEWVEGLYVFPLPADAAVDQMEMQVSDRVIRGEIQPREEARRTYEAARDSGRRASLVEQARPNMFTTSVANIPPGGEITVRIAYLTVVPWRDARYELKLPMAITPRFAPAVEGDAGWSPGPEASAGLTLPEHITPELVAPGLQTARIEIELNAGLPLATLHSPSHAIKIGTGDTVAADAGTWRGGKASATTGRRRIVAAAAPMDRDFELRWTPVIAPETQAAIYTEEFGGETYALLMLAPPDWGQSATRGYSPPREVIFIIDTSGSMGGPPIQQAKSALALAVQQLGPQDRFNIIEFNNEARALSRAPMAVDSGTRATAQRFIARLEANGGTMMHPALDMAFDMRVTPGLLRQVVFITDGSVGNETEVLGLVEERLGEARLFTVGIGPAPNDWFMREVAAAGRGSYTFIADVAEVGPRMGELFRKLEQPALVDLELHWPGGVTADLATPLPRDLYAGDPVALAARLTGSDPGKLLTLLGFSGGATWSRQAPLQQLEGEAGIAKLWARERIAELSRRKRLAGGGATTGRLSREALDTEIEALAMGYGLVSERTSLVAVDVTPARPEGAALAREQAPTTAPNGTAWARTSAFAQTATPAALFGWIGTVLLALALLLARPARPQWLHP